MKKLFRAPDLATLAVASVFAVAATVLRTVAISGQYNTATGYFLPGGANTAANILSVIFVALAAGWSFVSCTGKRIASDDPKYAKIASLTVGAIACFFLTTQAVMLLDGTESRTLSDLFLALAMACLAVGILYFVMVFLNQDGGMTLRAVGGFGMVAFGLFYTVRYYFIPEMPVNGDLKNQHIMAALAMMLFFLMKTRRSLYRLSGVTDRIFSLLALFFGASVSIPELIAHFTNPSADFQSFTHPLFLLALTAYAVVRLVAERAKPASEALEDKAASPTEQASEDAVSEPTVTELEAEPTEPETNE